MKTQERPLEVDFRLGDFSVEVSRLLAGRYRLLSQFVASNDVFERDFWGEIVVTFSHSLGRLQLLISAVLEQIKRPLSRKADVQNLPSKISTLNDRFARDSGR